MKELFVATEDLKGLCLKRELMAGISTFFATSYIAFVNPLILSESGLDFKALVTSTVLLTIFGTLLMGLLAKNPIVIAPGMGLNSFFSFSLVKAMNIPADVALGVVFYSGLMFLALSLTPLRESMAKSIPKDLKIALSAGIGLFIALIGLKNAGIIVSHPATMISLGNMNSQAWIFVFGTLLCIYLSFKKNPLAYLITIALICLIAFPLGLFQIKEIISAPDFSLFMHVDLKNSFVLALVPAMLTFLFTDLFDSLSTFLAVAHAGNHLDENGLPKRLKMSLLADSIATTFSGLFGSSPATSFIESAVGIQLGGKTGLTALFAALCFIPVVFFSPLISSIPAFATAPLLVVVGIFMLMPIAQINWKHLPSAAGAYLTFIFIPFTFSITTGLCIGIISYTLLSMACKEKVNKLLIFLTVLSFLYFIRH